MPLGCRPIRTVFCRSTLFSSTWFASRFTVSCICCSFNNDFNSVFFIKVLIHVFPYEKSPAGAGPFVLLCERYYLFIGAETPAQTDLYHRVFQLGTIVRTVVTTTVINCIGQAEIIASTNTQTSFCFKS